jgi:hypothetical protein
LVWYVLPRYNNFQFVKLNEGAHVGVLDIVFKTFKMNAIDENDEFDEKDVMKKVLKSHITAEFSVKAISFAVVL